MIRISKKIILFAIVVLSVGIYGIKYSHTSTNIQFANNAAIQNDLNSQISLTAYEQIKQEMHKQEQEAWNLLQTDTCVSKEECLEKQKNDLAKKSHQNKNRPHKRSRYPKLKEETIHFVENILHDFDVNLTDITIEPFRGGGTPAAADDDTIFIDEKEFARYSPKECTFIIAHEISHFKAQDESLFEAMEWLAHRKKISRQKRKKALNAFCCFQELRADMNALLSGGKKYACAALESLRKLQKLEDGRHRSPVHPKTSLRIETAQNICSKMGWNMEKDYVA